MIRSLLQKIFSYLFPATCIICDIEAIPTNLCSTCLSEFPAAIEECRPWILSLYHYRDLKFKEVIRHFKNYPDAEVIEQLLQNKSKLIDTWIANLIQQFPDHSLVLVPIPMHSSRYLERGYNQAEYIAYGLQQYLSSKFPNQPISIKTKLVSKNKQTKKQALIENKNERLENVQGAFSVNKVEATKLPPNALVIIIDDVTTSGGTMDEINRILEPTTKNVYGFTLGH
jgi:ComF family protein